MILRFISNQAVRSKKFPAYLVGGRSLAATATSGLDVANFNFASPQQRRSKSTTVAVQLDYYMSPQFAGIACALTEGLYQKAGIDEVKFLSICPVGLEAERVRQFRDISSDIDVVVGSVEQNVFLPLLLRNPELKLKAVAAMFDTSPLCLASIVEGGEDNERSKDKESSLQVVGAHEDTVDLLKRIMIFDSDQVARHKVVASSRATKNMDLFNGDLDAIQAYTTTEVPTLQRMLERTGKTGKAVASIPLEGLNGAKLGYSQMLFAPEEDLAADGGKHEILEAFLEATFEGWSVAINDPEHGAKSVEEAQKLTKLSDEDNDHWDRRDYLRYNTESTLACGKLVEATKKDGSDRYGVIDPERWDEATKWLLNEDIRSGFALDSTVWPAKR
uniref:Thiamine pyrimidine synthase n=1 Tax=Pseudo-nitzschia australis TaxID=44445 RepID=A0A7S4AF51_9STRA|mmetsp:Transcript_8832/g.19072  ORF Transcript_8832/g.19072 Transcript_8832/m.19072 type:complete len:388 (+) Transcript_8832:278-1441(+)